MIHGIKIASPSISHLFFVDDCIIFSRVTKQEVSTILNILHAYESASCQRVNFDKIELSFSQNVPDRSNSLVQEQISVTAIKSKQISWFTYLSWAF